MRECFSVACYPKIRTPYVFLFRTVYSLNYLRNHNQTSECDLFSLFIFLLQRITDDVPDPHLLFITT